MKSGIQGELCKSMSYVKTTGIVIKEVHTGEADKILTIFTRNLGKITASAKGARRPRSRLIAGTQLLCYSDFVLLKVKKCIPSTAVMLLSLSMI